MDKNTLTGVLLMGAVILGFMWLNQPSKEEIERQREQAEAQAREAQKAAENQPVLTVDSVSDLEKAQIAATVQQLGTLDTVTGTRTLSMPDAVLTLSKDGVTGGLVTTPAAQVPVADILSSDYGNLSPETAAKAVSTLRQALASAARYKGFARYLTGEEKTISLQNDVLALEVSTHGGVISSAVLKDYNRYDSTAVNLMDSKVDSYSFTLQTATQRFSTSEFYFTPVAVSDSSVTMQLNLGDGATWALRYTLPEKGYTVRMEILQSGMNAVIPQSVAEMDFAWHQKMARNEAGKMFEERNSALYYMFVNGDVENLKEGSSEMKEVKERVKWIGYKNQFFTALLVADQNFTSAKFDSEVLEGNPTYLKEMDTEATLEYSSVNPMPAAFTFFFGPNSYPLLSDLQDELAPGQNLHLTNLIPLGWALFRWINTLIVIPVFDFLGKFITNYGIIILLLTIFIKLILFPFTYKSYMSQAKMRVLAPEIKEI
ncbi:MAG: membrane protein insertase YidC, partial [Paramuribaculum sp.]|nr:membrane protein insertase YidC [Paramuribaculum sp.]